MWVFGYASLMWNPGFKYEERVVGLVPGYKRRFWMLNTSHRGIPGRPGRVATIVQDPDERVWGVAFKIPEDNIREVCEKLGCREKNYRQCSVNFYPRGDHQPAFEVMLYIVSPDHPDFEPADERKVANEIFQAEGPTGTNTEYVLKTTEFVRKHIPEDQDDHLFTLERLLCQASGA